MKINFANRPNFRMRYVSKVKPVAVDEDFFFINGAANYALSTYGRLYRNNPDDHTWKRVKERFDGRLGEYCYDVINDAGEPRTIPVEKLISLVFLPDHPSYHLLYPNIRDHSPRRWDLRKAYLLTGKTDMVEYIDARCNGRVITLPEDQLHIEFKNRYMSSKGKSLRYELYRLRRNMINRATNQLYKLTHKQYRNTTIAEEWISNSADCISYIMSQLYYYPEGRLVWDKDILGFGIANRYAPGLATFVPDYINSIFTSATGKYGGYSIQKNKHKDGTIVWYIPGQAMKRTGQQPLEGIICRTFEEALIAGRKRKAGYIRDVVSYERERGYMPEPIMDAMEKWADGVEAGKLKMFEPSEAVLRKMGITEEQENLED